MQKQTNPPAPRAAELLERLERGPSFAPHIGPDPFTAEEAEAGYRLWARSWVLGELVELVPELRTAAKLAQRKEFDRIVRERAAAGAAAADEPSTSSAESENDHA
jgi:hypothetical protein